MKISEAIALLVLLQKKYGDVDIATDCAFCGRVTAPDTIDIGPPVANLRQEVKRD